MSDTNTNSDWISILIIVIAGLISLLKARHDKKNGPVQAPGIPSPSYEEEEPEKAYDYQSYDDQMESSVSDKLFPGETKQWLSSDFYEPLNEQHTALSVEPEEVQEDGYEFNARQAIIGYEILRRPNY